MYYCVFCRQLERVRIHMHRYPPGVRMYIYVYKYTYSPHPTLVSLIYTHTRAVLPKNGQRNILDFTRRMGERSRKKPPGAATHAPDHIFRRKTPLFRSTKRGTFSSGRILHITDAYRLLHRHTRRISMRRHVKPCMYRRARIKREIITLRGANACAPFV